MPTNNYYSHGSVPQNGTPGDAQEIGAEFDSVQAGFAKLPALSGNGGKVVKINAGGTALESQAADVLLAETIHAATGKTTPVSADEFCIWDSVAGLLKKVTYANLVATIGGAYALLAGSASQTFSAAVATSATHVMPASQYKSGIAGIEATTGSNALTITLKAGAVLDFRSTTTTTGVPNTRFVPADISMVVSSGSTLGTTSAVQSRIIVLAIDNAGTVELACVNLAGSNKLDETNLINTTAEGGAGAADSASTIYSTTARTGVPYRVVGYVDSTQTTAGTWAQTLTVQGAGGNALTAMSSLGYGQTWQVVTRTSGVTYTNTTGKPILCIFTPSGASTMTVVVGGYTMPQTVQLSTTAQPFTFLVLAGQTYSGTVTAGSILATELR